MPNLAVGDLDAALAATGSRAKVRTGGSTPEAQPGKAELARFLFECAAERVPFKATAGLHHAIATASTHGFVNLFLAAAWAYGGGTQDEVAATLEETSAAAFGWEMDGVSWHGHRLSTGQIAYSTRGIRHRVRLVFVRRADRRFEGSRMDLMGRSWVETANDPSGDFPLQNLPLGVFRRDKRAAIGAAIGDRVLDLRACAGTGLLEGLGATAEACQSDSLNALMALGRPHWRGLRQRLTELLGDEEHREMVEPLLVAMADAEMLLPAAIGDYTDFYASIYHATNVGRLFRPDNPLLPNYKWVPIGYHGRASSIVVSGTPVRRASGQAKGADEERPRFGPSRSLDYEVEAGLLIGPGNRLGEPIPIAAAEEQIFGLCLVNDWSARDIQAWEYQPLGPFLAKSFATTMSPWVVSLEALEPFRAPAFARAAGDPEPLPYLTASGDRERGGIELTLEVSLSTPRMRAEGTAPFPVSRGNLRDLYWTPAQLVAHHASNGCNLRPGDLLATGTVSGPTRDTAGCLLEITRRGVEPLSLPGGESRSFLEDGDEGDDPRMVRARGRPDYWFWRVPGPGGGFAGCPRPCPAAFA